MIKKLLIAVYILFVAFTLGGPLLSSQQTTPTIKSLVGEIKTRADQIELLDGSGSPVDCVVSSPVLQSTGQPGACANNQQTRTDVWLWTVVSGAACPSALTEGRQVVTACNSNPNPTGAPSISAATTTGSNMTISGANFGTKAAQQPWKWDDMSGAAGARLEPRGWLVHVNTPQPTLSATQKRPNRTTSVMLGQTGNDVPDFAFGDNGQNYLSLTAASKANLRTPPTTLLIDYWMYFQNGGVANNYKFWRWHPLNNPASNNYWGMPVGSTDTESSEMSYFNAIGVQTIDKKWMHHRIYMHPDSTQSAVFYQHSIDQKVYMDTGANGDYVPAQSGFTAGPWPTLATGDRLSTWVWEMQNDTTGSSGARNSKMWLQDVVVDAGYGAVYLGSAATWAGSTHTEYQPYSAWAAGSITVKVNRGSFVPTAQVWLYVVTDGRAVNTQGFLVQ